MERLRRIADLWNWLPAFRAVAETEHLQRAAEMLNTSAPALSRTIRLLEDSLDAPLFRRNGGRHLELTDLGRALAAATREGMRRVDEVVATISPRFKLTGPLRVSWEGRLTTTYLLAALARLRCEHPELVPHITCVVASEVVSQLLRGDLDVALVFQPTPHDDIVVERLGPVTNGVYCGRSHSLHDVEAPTLSDVLAHPFVAPAQAPGPPLDNWPAEHLRRVALYSALSDGCVEACASGDLLGVFPDPIISSFRIEGALRRLPLEVVPPSSLFALKRIPVFVDRLDRAEAFIHEVKREVHGLAGTQRSSASRGTEAETAGVTSVKSPPIT